MFIMLTMTKQMMRLKMSSWHIPSVISNIMHQLKKIAKQLVKSLKDVHHQRVACVFLQK